MKILFAYNLSNHDNEYVRLLADLTAEIPDAKVICSLDEFWAGKKNFDYIVINWPEYLFRWRTNISDEECKLLEENIVDLKQNGSKIITVLHDEYSHFARNPNLNKIFDICYEQADVLIHLGNYSLLKYEKIYTQAKHTLVYHPLYTSFNLSINGKVIRKELCLKKNNFIVVVPGTIRKRTEFEYVNAIFKNLKIRNKKLVFLRLAILPKPKKVTGWYELKSFIYYYLKKSSLKYYYKTVFFSKFQSPEIVANYFAAANLILIPRRDILNSGNITLAAQFGKKIIGADFGNMAELLDEVLAIKITNPEQLKEINYNMSLQQLKDSSVIEKMNEYAANKIIVEQLKKVFS